MNNQKIINSSMIIKYQNMLFLFVIGSILGYVIEGLWSIVKVGHWESHTSMIWGPFCVIYGLGALIAYMISLIFSGKNIGIQFSVFALSGSLLEYLASLLQESIFGSGSWDYSNHFLNIEGRVSLQMAVAWGILGILFIRFLSPIINGTFEKLNTKKHTLVCVSITIFMLINMVSTAVVVMRWQERANTIAPTNVLEQTVDRVYPSEKLEEMFTGMRFLGKP